MEDTKKITGMFRNTTNGGLLSKYYIKWLIRGNQDAVVIDKLFLAHNEVVSEGLVLQLLKVYKGKYLYRQNIGMTMEICQSISSSLLGALIQKY